MRFPRGLTSSGSKQNEEDFIYIHPDICAALSGSTYGAISNWLSISNEAWFGGAVVDVSQIE